MNKRKLEENLKSQNGKQTVKNMKRGAGDYLLFEYENYHQVKARHSNNKQHDNVDCTINFVFCLQSGETGLVRIKASEDNYGKNKDGTYRKKNKGDRLLFSELSYLEILSNFCMECVGWRLHSSLMFLMLLFTKPNSEVSGWLYQTKIQIAQIVYRSNKKVRAS